MNLPSTVVPDNPSARLLTLLEADPLALWKAISLHQPYASLIAAGAKRYETRTWGAHYRGLILIHASKAWSEEVSALCLMSPFFEALTAGVEPVRALPRGAVVAAARLSTCLRVPRTPDAFKQFLATYADAREQAFGDWTSGRYVWRLDDVAALPEPIALRGKQGLFTVGSGVGAEVAKQLRLGVSRFHETEEKEGGGCDG